jgi:hypothetical protein
MKYIESYEAMSFTDWSNESFSEGMSRVDPYSEHEELNST